MIEDRVELSDITKYKRDMLLTLGDFKEHHKSLKHLNIEVDNENYQNVTLVKSQVIELADRFDEMQES